MRNRTLLIVLGAVAVLLLGLAGLGYWGWTLFTEQAKQALNDNPVIQEHIGEIDKLTLDFEATGNAKGEDSFVFRIEGSRGSGVVTADFVSVDDDTEEIRAGTLKLESGETHDLMPVTAPD